MAVGDGTNTVAIQDGLCESDPVGSVDLTESFIGVRTSGKTQAGEVFIATKTLSMENSGILAGTDADGLGGTIRIEATNSVFLDGSIMETVTSGTGAAGQIVLNSGELSLKNGSLITASTLGDGKGGGVSIHVDGSLAIENDAGISTDISSMLPARQATLKSSPPN